MAITDFTSYSMFKVEALFLDVPCYKWISEVQLQTPLHCKRCLRAASGRVLVISTGAVRLFPRLVICISSSLWSQWFGNDLLNFRINPTISDFCTFVPQCKGIWDILSQDPLQTLDIAMHNGIHIWCKIARIQDGELIGKWSIVRHSSVLDVSFQTDSFF